MGIAGLYSNCLFAHNFNTYDLLFPEDSQPIYSVYNNVIVSSLMSPSVS